MGSDPRPVVSIAAYDALEAGGDRERGRLVFYAGGCASCHKTPGAAALFGGIWKQVDHFRARVRISLQCRPDFRNFEGGLAFDHFPKITRR